MSVILSLRLLHQATLGYKDIATGGLPAGVVERGLSVHDAIRAGLVLMAHLSVAAAGGAIGFLGRHHAHVREAALS